METKLVARILAASKNLLLAICFQWRAVNANGIPCVTDKNSNLTSNGQ